VRLILSIAAAVLALDQLTKLLVVQLMGLKDVAQIEVLPPYFNFMMAWNRGVNFGLLSGGSDVTRWLLISVAVAISVWVLWWMRHETRTLARISAGLLVGGAIGNVADRLIYGAVADFLNVTCCGIENPFAFNIADVVIFVGAFGLILFTGEKKTP
jgi:signal peptidase II